MEGVRLLDLGSAAVEVRVLCLEAVGEVQMIYALP